MILEDRTGGVVTLTFNDPKRRNAFSMELRLDLLERLRRLEPDPTIRVIVLTGGAEVFCVGGDISAMGRQAIGPALERLRVVHEICRLVLQSGKPYIAAVEGWAVGGGLSLALLCDTIVAAASARFKAPFGDLGVVGDIGIMHTLPARVGVARAKQILFYGETISAPDALACGLVDHVVDTGQAGAEAARRAALLEARAPLPFGLTKSILNKGLDDLLAREREVQAMLLGSADHEEGKSAFFDKRRPNFAGQ